MPRILPKGSCPICAHPLPKSNICTFCRDFPAGMFGVRAPFLYADEARAAIRAMKYSRFAPLADMFALKMASIAMHDIRPFYPFDTITYVPMHKIRIFRRGFDHARTLAESLSCLIDAPIELTLVRSRATPAQTAIPFAARAENVSRAFAPLAVRPVNYLLIDDVITSGSTAKECARTLIEAGATGVFVLAATMAGGRLTSSDLPEKRSAFDAFLSNL